MSKILDTKNEYIGWIQHLVTLVNRLCAPLPTARPPAPAVSRIMPSNIMSHYK